MLSEFSEQSTHHGNHIWMRSLIASEREDVMPLAQVGFADHFRLEAIGEYVAGTLRRDAALPEHVVELFSRDHCVPPLVFDVGPAKAVIAIVMDAGFDARAKERDYELDMIFLFSSTVVTKAA